MNGKHSVLSVIDTLVNDEVTSYAKAKVVSAVLKETKDDPNVSVEISHGLAMNMAQKDMKWKTALAGPLRDDAIKAWKKEYESLTSTVLKPIHPHDPDFKIALESLHLAGYFLMSREMEL